MKLSKKIGWVLLVLGVLFSAKESFSQLTLITNVKYSPGQTEDYLDFTTTSRVRVQRRVFPQTNSVLIQLIGAEFMPDSEDRFVSVVKRCFLHPNVAQLSDGTIYILFKGISSSKIHVVAAKHRLRLQILKKSPQAAYLDNYRKGVALVKSKKYEAALTYLRRALRYRPGDAGAFFWAGKARFALGDWKAAQFNLEQARQEKSFSNKSQTLLAFIRAKEAKGTGGKAIVKHTFSPKKPATQTKPVPQAVKKANTSKMETVVQGFPQKKTASSREPVVQTLSKNRPAEKSDRTRAFSETSLAEGAVGSSFQLFLFFAILILFAFLPFLWFWNKRVKRKKSAQKTQVFEKNLEAFQIRQQQLLRQFNTGKSKKNVENDSAYKTPNKKSAAPLPQQKEEPPVFAEEPLIRNRYSEDEIVKKAKRFASRGYTYDEIAKKLGIGKGELQLIMNLAGETIQMEQTTGMRLTFAEDS